MILYKIFSKKNRKNRKYAHITLLDRDAKFPGIFVGEIFHGNFRENWEFIGNFGNIRKYIEVCQKVLEIYGIVTKSDNNRLLNGVR